MTALRQPEENENELPLLPLTPELIGKITNQQTSSLNAEQIRKLRRIIRPGFCGCVVIVCEDGHVVEDGIYQVKKFIIGPAEK
jgi:hypothetical protein